MEYDIVIYIVIVFVIYKILDRLIRIPRIGNYHNRYIFITGCDTGFGNLLAKRLDHLGCHVFAGCLTEKGETELKKVSSVRLHTISLDVTKQDSVRKAFDFVKSKLPQGRGLHGLVNNAGVFTKGGFPDWLRVEDYRNQSEVNLWGLIDVTLNFLPLVKAEKGRVVNMASAAGRISIYHCLPYNISKYGVEAFTDGLRCTISFFGCKAILLEPSTYNTDTGSKDNFRRCFRKGWDEASPQIKAEYGEELATYFQTTGVDELLASCSDRLDDVTDAYEEALLAYFPRARYSSGLSKIHFFVIQAVPEWLGDWAIRKINSGSPLPAAVRK